MSEKKKLLIIGAGQYGKLVREIAAMTEQYDRIDFIDDNSDIAVGKVEEIDKYKDEYGFAIVAIGNPDIKEKMTDKLLDCGYVIETIIHPKAYVSPSSNIGIGCVIEANVVINTESVIHDGVFVSAGAVINHNSVVNSFSHIDCNAVVESNSVVPEKIKIHSCEVFNSKV